MKDYKINIENTTTTNPNNLQNLRISLGNHSKYFFDQGYQYSKKINPTIANKTNNINDIIRKSPNHSNQESGIYKTQNKYTQEYNNQISGNRVMLEDLNIKYKKLLETKKNSDQGDYLVAQSKKNNIKDLRSTTSVIPTYLYADYKKEQSFSNHIYHSPRKQGDYVADRKKNYKSPQRRYQQNKLNENDFLNHKSTKLTVPSHNHNNQYYSPSKFDLTNSNIQSHSNIGKNNNQSVNNIGSLNAQINHHNSSLNSNYYNPSANSKYDKTAKEQTINHKYLNILSLSPNNNAHNLNNSSDLLGKNTSTTVGTNNTISNSQSKKYRLLQLLQKCDKIQAETNILNKKSPDTRGLISSNQNEREKEKTLKQLREKYKQYLQPPTNSKLYASTNSKLSPSNSNNLTQSTHPLLENQLSKSYQTNHVDNLHKFSGNYSSNNSFTTNQSDNGKNRKYSKQYSFNYEQKYHHFQQNQTNQNQMFKKKKQYLQGISVKTPQNKQDIKNIYQNHVHAGSGHNSNIPNKNLSNNFSKKQTQLTPKQNIYPKPPNINLPTTPKIFLNFTLDDFYIGKNKGQGKFGVVYIVKHKITNTLYALKKIQKSVIKSHMMEQQLAREIKLQIFFNNPNILKLYSFFDDKQHIYLLLQYMEEGTLFQQLKKRKEKLHEREVSFRIKQIANAIRYLHDLDIAHRDIKPQNIVLSNGVAKLCDFGWSTRCQNRRKTYCGTFDYAPPQILEGKQYDWCVDLWCLGVLTFELLTGKVPFYNISRKQTMKKILNVDKNEIEFPNDISWQAKDFVECLIKKDPHERKRADELFDHPFLQKYTQEHKYF